MSHLKPSDRRASPRFQAPVTLSLAIAGAQDQKTVDANVLNVSNNGVYCQVHHYLPLFEKLLITFELPEHTDPAHCLISQCEGVVVRIDPEDEEPGRTAYNVALYFNNLTEAERNLLQTFIVTYGEQT